MRLYKLDYNDWGTAYIMATSYQNALMLFEQRMIKNHGSMVSFKVHKIALISDSIIYEEN